MKTHSLSSTGDYERKKLDVNLFLVLFIAIAITIFVYSLAIPLRTSFVGTLLYERGLTQYIVVYLAGVVVALTAIKFTKVQQERIPFTRNWIPETINFDNPNSQDILSLQKILARNNRLLTIRCSRVLAAYINSGSRKAAMELALDDSSFYQSASESSYTFPRILVWSIPLLGFIGTVVGISQAVSGFSGFLEQAGEIDQIKEGIGTVTSGLAVAFDTTLLALFLSVIVMIPLVLVERFESRLLLAIDIYINDRLLPRLKENRENLDENTINRAIDRAIKDRFPSPEALIEPAREYAQEAASNFIKSFVSEVESVQRISQQLVEQLSQVNQLTLQDRQGFITALEGQQKASQDLVSKLQTITDEIKSSHSTISTGFQEQAGEISHQLEGVATVLENRIISLEQATSQISEFAKLQESLEKILLSLEKAQKLDSLLIEMQATIIQLKPVLEKLSKPRLITFMEEDRSL